MNEENAQRPPNDSHCMVAVIDDHLLLAESLVRALREAGITAQSIDPSSPRLADDVAACDPGVVLLDMVFGDDADFGLRLIAALRAPGRQVVMVTGVTDRLKHAEAISLGAVGILDKAKPIDAVIDAVRRVLSGLPLMGQTERLELELELDRARRRARQANPGFASLTPKEREVLAAIVEGRPAGRIARDHRVSVATVRSHIRAILAKLDVHSQLEAVSLARRQGWTADVTD